MESDGAKVFIKLLASEKLESHVGIQLKIAIH